MIFFTKIRQFIRRLFSRDEAPPALDPEAAERLRVDFKARYHHFKLLLGANNRALEMMTEMETALRGETVFGMTFVRSRCTGISVNVLRMVQNLRLLAPGKYGQLRERFDAIQREVDAALSVRRESNGGGAFIVPLSDTHQGMTDAVGGKMASLGEAARELDLNVPAGFVITARAYEHYFRETGLQTEIDRRFQAMESERSEDLYSLSADLQQRIIRTPLPEDLRAAIEGAVARLQDRAGGDLTVALRSSALGEDGSGRAFAGQYRTELNLRPDNVIDAYREVVAGKYSYHAIVYRLNRGFRDEDVSMSVGCMEMVDARAGGVAYSRNPVDIRDDAVHIHSAWGLPKAVVDGSAPCDLFVMSRDDPPRPVRERVVAKAERFVCFPDEGVCRFDLTGDARDAPSLTPEQRQAVARIALALENDSGAPQDVEWALNQEGEIVLLQCRPFQQMESGRRAAADPETPDPDRLLTGGVTASPGVGAGPVTVVRTGADALTFPDGGVLATRQARPGWASLMNRAAAVVAEQGGAAGHLANVAREFGVPALFGAAGALERLSAGETVTVDADGAAVYRGRREDLLAEGGVRPTARMEGSPVLATLERAAEAIVPLHLLDPAGPDFAPENCRTFHDITRFCHEQSVTEMFRFGRDHEFPERSSKQLFYKVPMQWWILNLDDGFREEVAGKYVELENIASIPMRAFWDGFAAIPWEGPPVDGRGLMSVMFQSTANQALTPGIRSEYAQRNYFMISRNFCGLSSRLGYHFSTLEALVSERAGENYVRFGFKGGAADLDRRRRRAAFIQEVLEAQEFRVTVREDHLTAQLDGHPREFMESQLRVLGYLTLHTRQLDMIMANPARVAHYRQKIARDVETVRRPAPEEER
jgi:pyruvate,water dikinase